MKYLLVIFGALAALAIMAPMSVVLGYLCLVIPGLILTFAPTVFVYLAATAVVRRLLPISSLAIATMIAFGLTIFLGWAVMQPFRGKALAEYQAESLPDVIPNHPIVLDGHVRIERPDQNRDPECDYLCLAILDSPGVRSVTSVTAGRDKQTDQWRSAAYALESATVNPDPGIVPTEPGQIVRKYPPLIQAYRGRELIVASKSVEADWAVRLAGRERLRKIDPVARDAADWVIGIENHSHYPTTDLRRVTICDSNGTVRFRKSYHKQAVPARMFYFGFQIHAGGGTISGASFHVGRQLLVSGDLSLNPESALLMAIDLSLPSCDPETIELLRFHVERSLDDPAATAVQLDMARQFLGLFFFDAAEHDQTLIARIVADDRVLDIDEQVKNIFSKQKTPLAMRDAYAARIVMDHTSASLRYWLAECLAYMPPGTFADPTAAHFTIWNTPELYQEAAPFIATLADLGPKRAMPGLATALDTALELPQRRERRPLIEGIRAAYIRLGPQALAAAPRIGELFLTRPSPILNNSDDADQWRFALARMGVAIQDLPVFPNQSPRTVERICRRIADKLRRYEQDRPLGAEL